MSADEEKVAICDCDSEHEVLNGPLRARRRTVFRWASGDALRISNARILSEMPKQQH